MTAAWMTFATWLVRYRHAPHPAYSAWIPSFIQDSSIAFAAWFIIGPDTRLSVVRRVGCAAASGLIAFLAGRAYFMAIITSQGASTGGFEHALLHASEVLVRGFRSSGWLHLTILILIGSIVAVVADPKDAARAPESTR